MEQEKILTANDYIKKAEECEKYNEYSTALKYFQKAYELDPRLKAAKGGVERMEKEIANQIFFRTEANYKLTNGRLELRKGRLVFIGRNGTDMSYQLTDMQNIRVEFGRLTFDYPGESAPVGFSCKAIKEWISLLADAKEGKYPNSQNGGLNILEKYIADHFTKETMAEAIEYCTQMSVMGYADAKIVVERIFG